MEEQQEDAMVPGLERRAITMEEYYGYAPEKFELLGGYLFYGPDVPEHRLRLLKLLLVNVGLLDTVKLVPEERWMTLRSALRFSLTRPSRRADIVRMALPVLKGPFTVESYQRLGELGILREDDRVELINGQVVEMTPIGTPHTSCVNRLNTLFAPLAGRQATLSVQNPLVLGTHQAPQPDFAVLRHRPDGYRANHPGPADVLLVIEVADSSLDYDRDTKIPLYAEALIPEAWLVDLTGDRIGIFREPRAGAYRSVRWAARGEILAPLLLPQVTLAVTEILG